MCHRGYNWEDARAIIDIIDAHAVIQIYIYIYRFFIFMDQCVK